MTPAQFPDNPTQIGETPIVETGRLTAVHLCVQLGRYISRNSGLAFVEPTVISPGHIYACPLPAKARRLTPAVAIVPQPTAGGEPMGIATSFTILMHAVGINERAVMDILRDAQRILRPSNRSTVLTEGTHRPGIIGVPTTAGDHGVWRILTIEALSNPQTISPRSPGGEAVGETALSVLAVEDTTTVEE